MTERDWSAWFDIIDPNSGEVFFSCEHCGTGDYGWNRTDSGLTTHYATDEDLFNAASWVWRERAGHAEIRGFLAGDFLAWYNCDFED